MLYQKLIDGKLGWSLPLARVRTLREKVMAEYRATKVISRESLEMLNIMTEQGLEEIRLRVDMSSHTRHQTYVKPYPVMHVEWDNEAGIGVHIFAPRDGMSKRFSVTYNSAGQIMRASAMKWFEGLLADAQRDVYEFFRDSE